MLRVRNPLGPPPERAGDEDIHPLTRYSVNYELSIGL